MRFYATLISIILVKASLVGFTPAYAGFPCFENIKSALTLNLFRGSQFRREMIEHEKRYLTLLNSFAAKKSQHASLSKEEIEKIRKSLIQASDEVLRLEKQRFEAEGGFRTIPMQPEYVGESMGLDSFRMDQHLKPYNIDYIQNAVMRDDYRIRISNKGDFTDLEGAPMNGIYDAVMDQDGNVYGYLRDSAVGAYYNHSSFLSGLPAAAAVELKFVDGKLVEVSGQSGHYKPTEEINDQFFTMLRRKKIDTSKIKYSHSTRLTN